MNTLFSPFRLTLVALGFSVWACLQDGEKDTAGVSVVENEIVGRILADDDGSAAGVSVKLFAADGAGQALDSTRTDNDGEYRFKSLKPGVYSTLAQSETGLAFDDQIAMVSGNVERPRRHLRPGGSVRTAVALNPGDDVSTVTAVVLGSDFISTPSPDGNMGMDHMPEGTLRIRIRTTLPGYLPLDAKLTIISGKETRIDTLHLPQAR